MRKSLRDHSLSVAFLAIFLLALIGQSVAGLAYTNEQLEQHQQPSVGYFEFVTSSDFLVDVAENWQSEFLQFFLFILATVWLIQRGSPESKKPGDEGVGSDKDQLVGELGTIARLASLGVLEFAPHPDGIDLPAVMARTISCRADRRQRRERATRVPAGFLDRVRRLAGLLEPDASELAVGVPRRRCDGRIQHLPSPARVQ